MTKLSSLIIGDLFTLAYGDIDRVYMKVSTLNIDGIVFNSVVIYTPFTPDYSLPVGTLLPIRENEDVSVVRTDLFGRKDT